jgi:hypothetical protein
MILDEGSILLPCDTMKDARSEARNWKLQAGSGCCHRDVLVLVFGCEGVNANRVTLNGTGEVACQRGTQSVYLVFVRKFEKDMGILQLDQLGGPGGIAMAQGQVESLRVLRDGDYWKLISRLVGGGLGSVELLGEYRRRERENDFEDTKVHVVAGPQDDIRSGVLERSLRKVWRKF